MSLSFTEGGVDLVFAGAKFLPFLDDILAPMSILLLYLLLLTHRKSVPNLQFLLHHCVKLLIDWPHGFMNKMIRGNDDSL